MKLILHTPYSFNFYVAINASRKPLKIPSPQIYLDDFPPHWTIKIQYKSLSKLSLISLIAKIRICSSYFWTSMPICSHSLFVVISYRNKHLPIRFTIMEKSTVKETRQPQDIIQNLVACKRLLKVIDQAKWKLMIL